MVYLIYRFKVSILISLVIWAGLVWLLGWKGALFLSGTIFLASIGYAIWAHVHQSKAQGN